MKQRNKEANEILTRYSRMPIAVFILGILSVVMLFWIYWIEEKQRMTGEYVNAVLDFRLKTTTFHLWFEEAITDGSIEELGRTFEHLDDARMALDALSYGGNSEHGKSLVPINDPTLLKSIESLRTLLYRVEEVALDRYEDPEASGIGSAIEKQFNVVFNEFQEEAQAFDILVEKSLMSDQVESKRLLLGTAFLWISIVMASMIGLYKRENHRRRAELALQEAYQEIEQRVKVRTAELENVNTQLLEEIAERKRVEDSLKVSDSEFRRLSRQFHALVNAMPDHITLLSSDLRIQWANSGAPSTDQVSAILGRHCTLSGTTPQHLAPAARYSPVFGREGPKLHKTLHPMAEHGN